MIADGLSLSKLKGKADCYNKNEIHALNLSTDEEYGFMYLEPSVGKYGTKTDLKVKYICKTNVEGGGAIQNQKNSVERM